MKKNNVVASLILVGSGMAIMGAGISALAYNTEAERITAVNQQEINKLTGEIVSLKIKLDECAKRADLFQDSAIELALATSEWLGNIFGPDLDLSRSMDLADEAATYTCSPPES